MAEKRKSEDQQQQNGNASKVLKSDDFHTSQEFKQALLSHPVEYLAYRKKDGIVFFVDRSDKVSDVFKGLIKHNFLSVPVLQKHKHKWYGFVEVGDIVQFYVENFGDKLGDEGKATWDAIAQNEGFGEKTVNDVMKYPLTRKNPFHPITLGYSLFYAFETLAKEEELHRVPIIDRDRNLKSVLTLSQVVEYVHDNLEILGTIKNKPIKDIPGAIKPVVFINHKAKAIEGFKLMQQKNVGGLAVVDEEGKIVGHLSQRDLKGIRLDNQLFQRLFQETHNFIRHLRSEFKDSHPKTKQVLHETETLGDAVKLLVEHNIHRAFVVDKDHKPIGVVALKDILLEIITH